MKSGAQHGPPWGIVGEEIEVLRGGGQAVADEADQQRRLLIRGDLEGIVYGADQFVDIRIQERTAGSGSRLPAPEFPQFGVETGGELAGETQPGQRRTLRADNQRHPPAHVYASLGLGSDMREARCNMIRSLRSLICRNLPSPARRWATT